ncbi:MAG: PEP-CTERM sorting domain-containing protein [Pirellulales bacterium]|nr:PEP-CTERM sorting domain-containing protein [Pirellulales bacterium]
MNWQLLTRAAACGSLAIALFAPVPAQAQSLVNNFDFEVDADTSGNPDQWFHGGSTAYVTNDDSDGVGTHSVSAQDGGDWRSQAFPILPLQTLQFSVDYKVSQGATGTARTDVRFFTGLAGDGGTSGNFVGEFAPTIDVASVPQGVWNTWGPFTVNVPAGNPPPLVIPAFGDVRLSAGIFGPDLVGTIQWDNVRIFIPEPASMGMLAFVGAGLLIHRRRARK